MKRLIKFGPERVEPTLVAIDNLIDELRTHGVPDGAAMHFASSSDGPLLINIEYEEEAGPLPEVP